MQPCAVVVIAGLLLGAALPTLAQHVRCDGTLLELAVVEEGSSQTDRFQFALWLEVQASSKNDALNELNRRLGTVRRKMSGLAVGDSSLRPHALTRLAAQRHLRSVIRPPLASQVR